MVAISPLMEKMENTCDCGRSRYLQESWARDRSHRFRFPNDRQRGARLHPRLNGIYIDRGYVPAGSGCQNLAGYAIWKGHAGSVGVVEGQLRQREKVPVEDLAP